jgi:hypothetical protein
LILFSSKGCGGVLTSQQGSFASPGYPQPYHHSALCTWEIKVSRGSRIQLVFIDIDLEIGADCRSVKTNSFFSLKHGLLDFFSENISSYTSVNV